MMNSGSISRQKTLGDGVDHVIEYLKRMKAENPCFFYAIQSENGNGNIFWADSSSRANYIYFGDTVRFDASSYRIKSNCYKQQLPFATFTGLNHHAQPVLFGCALLLNESDASFVWLLQTWLQAMSGKPPLSITIQDPPHRLIQIAVSHALPETRLRFSGLTIFSQTKEKLAHIYHMHPTFDIEFNKCVNEAETIDGFESHWRSILEKYYLLDNEWLQSIYSARHQWVPIYTRNIFFGEFSTPDENDAINSFFHGFVDLSTTIQVLIKQVEKAMANWHEMELKADLDTTNSTPLLKTPSPMEKQAANLYTRRIFMKFQEELVETLANLATKIDDTGTVATYRVAKFGEEHRAQLVRFDALEMKSSCSCQMFEFSGLICRHVLSVFRAKNVLTLPSQYVLQRWTRNAKSGDKGAPDDGAPEFQSNSRESLNFRHHTLRHEAIKFVEEGAKSIHIYNVAVSVLHEAAKKVSAAKKKNFGTIQGSSFENGDTIGMHPGEEKQATNCQSTDEKEKKILDLTAELECINHGCEVYRANLLTVLRDMEDQKLKLSVKVQNARLSLKE